MVVCWCHNPLSQRNVPSILKVPTNFRARIEAVLEENCRELHGGGDHETRRIVAEKLLEAVNTGRTTLGELGIVARKAVAEIVAGSSDLAQGS